jgi:hypothetical protein
MNICNIAPTAGDVGISNARILAAGEPLKSTLLTDVTQPKANFAILRG